MLLNTEVMEIMGLNKMYAIGWQRFLPICISFIQTGLLEDTWALGGGLLTYLVLDENVLQRLLE